MEPVIGAGAYGAANIYNYNRDNFLYDRNMRQETEYQVVDFRIKQALLWREDIRDLIELTTVKMQTYLMINTFMLVSTVMLLCEGQLAYGTPPWLFGMYILSLASSFMYLLMSVWFAMHASVTARSYKVRLLSQLVRLPMPTWDQLESCRNYGSAFEKVESRQMFRVPFLQGSQANLNDKGGDGNLEDGGGPIPFGVENRRAPVSDVWGLEGSGDRIYELDAQREDMSRKRHIRLLYEAQQYWQSFEGYARVSLTIGAIKLTHALSYYILGYVLVANGQVMPAWLIVGILMASATLLIRLDMSLTAFEYRIGVVLCISGPFVTAIAAARFLYDGKVAPDLEVFRVSPVLICHALWLLFVLYISDAGDVNGAMLPQGFRSVMYVDVFGWLQRTTEQHRQRRQDVHSVLDRISTAEEGQVSRRPASLGTAGAAVPNLVDPLPAMEHVSGNGPAVQSVSYSSYGRPVPVRPEIQPGAAQSLESQEVREEDFFPTTFVAADASDSAALKLRDPTLVPWRIFSAATLFLAVLWVVSGILLVAQSMGWTYLDMSPLLEWETLHYQPNHQEMLFDEPLSANSVLQLSDGQRLKTHWPRAGMRLRSLSCGGGGSNAWVVASTRTSVLTARIAADSVEPVEFATSVACQSLTGGAEVQGVGVECASSSSLALINSSDLKATASTCNAVILHDHGKQLSSCPLSGVGAPARFLSTSSGTSVVKTLGLVQKPLSAFAIGGHCGNGNPCAYGEVDSDLNERPERHDAMIVQLEREASAGTGNNSGTWIPGRALHLRQRKTGRRAMTLLGHEGRYLGMLDSEAGFLQTIDIQASVDAVNRSSLVELPVEHRWTAACGLGDDVYLLTGGLSPQLWRFSAAQLHQQEPRRRSVLQKFGDEIPAATFRALSKMGRLHSKLSPVTDLRQAV